METKTLEVLKLAILMERKGQAFYTQVARQTNNDDVKKIFEIMAKEEVLHEQFLSEQFKAFAKDNKLSSIALPKSEDDGIANMILNKDIKKSLSAASFEAAAISASIDMENNAIKVYSERAEQASDPNEKELFSWLANWEKSHLQILKDLDAELKEEIWFDNQFWPF